MRSYVYMHAYLYIFYVFLPCPGALPSIFLARMCRASANASRSPGIFLARMRRASAQRRGLRTTEKQKQNQNICVYLYIYNMS